MTLNRDDVPRTRNARLQEIFRDESNGGIAVMLAAVIAIIWANSAWSTSYEKFINIEIGTESFHLSLAHWVSDLLLAIFFFVVGIELKYEITFGSLASFRRALIPTTAALGGMVFAAIIFAAFNLGTDFIDAWAIPISTDIAFALALLAIVGRQLPNQLRVFLLTLAVVNDLAAITVIALFYGGTINWMYLAISALSIFIFAVLQRTSVTSLGAYIPLAGIAWYTMHMSGIHATVAGVILGIVMRNRQHDDETSSPAAHAEHTLRPFTAGFCVPLFALVTAGINISGISWSETFRSPLTLGIMCGLLIGQPLGVVIATKLVTLVTKSSLPQGLAWIDIWVIGSLASIGFTVALLVSDVSFTASGELATAKFAIVLTNILAIAIASAMIKFRVRLLGKPAL